MTNREEIERRRTFAIISHPDAGKTTLTEKLLLYGGAINQAGSVKGKQSAKHAVSDWMDIEKQRGISVTSSVLQFNYAGKCVNILDTPGHQDFSEDTYRTLMAADSAVMVIDAAKGVEAQTIKLFKALNLTGDVGTDVVAVGLQGSQRFEFSFEAVDFSLQILYHGGEGFLLLLGDGEFHVQIFEGFPGVQHLGFERHALVGKPSSILFR